jgi:glyoxylase-like metal-dependent hydrolase (beta-lactamase superfamily II)
VRRVQLTDHIWLVGSGAMGFSITDQRDCHVYLVADGDEAVLVDAGAGIGVERILDEIERSGVGSAAIKRIVLTHAHADHCGGARPLSEALGARVLASSEVAGILRAGDGRASSFEKMKQPGGYPDDYTYRSCEVDGELSDGERLAIGSLHLEAVGSPGHSSGHLSYLLRRPGGTDLFSGDAAFGLGRILLQDLWDCSIPDSTQTVRALAGLKPDGLYPGHGVIAVQNGWEHLYSAMGEISSGLPPRQLTF